MKRRSRLQALGHPTRNLSARGPVICSAVFGGLVLGGFVFGVVIGYEPPRPVIVTKAAKEMPTPTEGPAQSQSGPRKDEPAAVRVGPAKELPVEPPPKAELPKAVPNLLERSAPKPTKVESKPQALIPISFQKEVLPILRAHCLTCHGAGTGKPKADVNLTSIASMRRSPGKLLVPGKPEASDLYTSIVERDMPNGGRPKPTERELTTMRNWILAGAKERRRIVRRWPRSSPR